MRESPTTTRLQNAIFAAIEQKHEAALKDLQENLKQDSPDRDALIRAFKARQEAVSRQVEQAVLGKHVRDGDLVGVRLGAELDHARQQARIDARAVPGAADDDMQVAQWTSARRGSASHRRQWMNPGHVVAGRAVRPSSWLSRVAMADSHSSAHAGPQNCRARPPRGRCCSPNCPQTRQWNARRQRSGARRVTWSRRGTSVEFYVGSRVALVLPKGVGVAATRCPWGTASSGCGAPRSGGARTRRRDARRRRA